MSRSPTLEIGYVRSAFGIRGEVAIRFFDSESEALDVVKRVQLICKDGTRLELSTRSQRASKGESLVHFEGVESRTQAARLVGARVSVFREDLPPPGENEVFQGDLIGLEAITEAGQQVGYVEEVWNTGPVPNLVIRGSGGFELIVPFADEFVPSVDLIMGRLVVRPPVYAE